MNTRAWAAVVCACAGAASAQVNNAFTYQGELKNSGQPAQGAYDLRFRLYDLALNGAQVGAVLCADNVQVVDGRFTVELDFGAAFTGNSRFLEIDVRQDTGQSCAVATGYTTLSPRRKLTAAPHAAYALSAGLATNATTLGGNLPSFYTSASNLTSGTLSDGRLSGNVTLLSSAQSFSGVKTFSAPPVFSAAGAPFSVGSAALVSNLNADLLDGLNSTAFAPATHTHDAGSIVSGTLSDARLSSNIARLSSPNTFTAGQTFSVGGVQTPLTLTGSNNQGTWLTIGNTLARSWNIISSSTNNAEGAGKLVFRDATANAVRMTIDTAGFLGVGTTTPGSLLELSGADAAARIRNVNDPGGGVVFNSFATLQFGLYNPGASAWGVVPAGGRRSMLGMDSTGRVGTLTNTGLSPSWRNTLDDGSGNATIQGNLSANNMPAIKHASTTQAGSVSLSDVTLIENITVSVPASGFLRITARTNMTMGAYDFRTSQGILELKETTSGEVTIKQSRYAISDGTATPSGMQWAGEMTLEHFITTGPGTRSFKLRLMHSSSNGSNYAQYDGAQITVMYFPDGL